MIHSLISNEYLNLTMYTCLFKWPSQPHGQKILKKQRGTDFETIILHCILMLIMNLLLIF